MIELLSFLKLNDPNPPDFVGKMVDEGKCKPSVRQYPSSMDENEFATLK